MNLKKTIAKMLLPLILLTTPLVGGEKSKGVYMTSWVAGSQKFYEIVENMKGTDLNTLVIDLKDASGHVAFNMDDSLVDLVGSEQRRITHEKLEEIMNYCDKNNIYSIARIVVGKDPIMAEYAKSRNAIKKDTLATPSKWVDLFSSEVQEYNIRIAEEAERIGFDEINFDYIRFPDPKEVKNPVFPYKDERPLAEGVREFLKKADERLDIKISVDVYAYTVWGTMKKHQDEKYNWIGQVIELMAEHADYIYPMLYPSHFRDTDRAIISESHPEESVEYAIVSEGCRNGMKRLANVKDTDTRIVPWIQGFSMKDEFNADYILNQIRAAKERNIDGYLIWNPNNNYEMTWKALKPKLVEE